MQFISSLDNQKVKHVASLANKKYRLQHGEYVAEGVRWVFDAMEHFKSIGSDQISQIVVKKSMLDKFNDEILSYDDRILVLDDHVFDKLSDEESSQGILAVYKMNKEMSVGSRYCLFLDRVRDPGNLGTILRTALAAGFLDVLCYDCVDAYNPKVIRSSMTAILKLNIVNSSYDGLFQLKNDGHSVVCADVNGQNVFEFGQKLDKVCLVIGNEANGISPQILQQSNFNLKIPMEGIESLNASVSAGILMYLLKYKI